MQNRRAITVVVSVLTAFITAFAALSTLVVSAPAASAATTCTTSWKSVGTSGSFEQAANWTAGVPTSTSTACLPASAVAYTVTESANETALGLVVNSGATLRVLANGASGTTIALNAGSGGITNTGTIELGGQLSPNGNVAAINVSGAFFMNQGLVHSIYSHGGTAKVN